MARLAFLTGATGFVGRHLVERLVADRWRVRALVRPTSNTRELERLGVELVRGDLGDPSSIAAGVEGADVVFHLAAVVAARTEREYASANADGTASVVAGIRSAATRPR